MENVTTATHENPCVAINGLTDLHLRTPQQLTSVLKWRAEALRGAGFDLDATVAECAAKFLDQADCWLCRDCQSWIDADDDVPERENGVVIADDIPSICPNGIGGAGMTQLKPCPFCGCDDIRHDSGHMEWLGPYFLVWCGECGAEVECKETPDNWNRRTGGVQ